MKMQLDFPYIRDYKAAYVAINTEPRRVVTLVRNDGTKTSTSYARYIKSVQVGRYLNITTEHVDHVNDNPLDDFIDNLQILTPSQNNQKGKRRTLVKLICPICNSEFEKEARQVNHKIANGKNPTCSRRCGGIASHKNK